MRDRGRGAPLDHECANPAVGEDLQGMAIVMRQRLTPQSLACSTGYRADRRHSTVPNNSLALKLLEQRFVAHLNDVPLVTVDIPGADSYDALFAARELAA